MELEWDLTNWTVLDVQLFLADKSDIWILTLRYPFSPLATDNTVQILVHLVTFRMHGEHGIMAFIYQFLFQIMDIRYTESALVIQTTIIIYRIVSLISIAN